MNKTLTKYFSKISLQKLWDANLDDFENIPETQRLMLLAICENRPANLEEIYHFLDQPDALFNDIYQEREVRDSVFFIHIRSSTVQLFLIILKKLSPQSAHKLPNIITKIFVITSH